LFSHIPLNVDAVLTLDAHLVISSAKETVTVTSEAVAPVNINDAQVGNLVDSRQMTDLPSILRDPYALILLSPGVIQSNTLFGGFSVNGSRERSNNFLLDGTDNNDPDFGGFPRGLSSLNPETTQEFRVITNSYLPSSGAIAGPSLTSSQNTARMIFMRTRTGLAAIPRFRRRTTLPPTATMTLSCAIRVFGYSFSGPIQKNRTFFFVNEELQRFSTTILNASIVPTEAFKKGVFTYTSNGQSIPIDVSTPGSLNMPGDSPLTPPCSKSWHFIRPPMGRSWTVPAQTVLPSHSLANGTALPDESTTTSEAAAFSPCITLTTSIRITTIGTRTFSRAGRRFHRSAQR